MPTDLGDGWTLNDEAPAPAHQPGDIQDMVRAAARQHGVDPDLALRVAQAESGNSPTAISAKGAIGVMQLMPDTAKGFGVNPYDPKQNIDGGVRYLAYLNTRYNGDTRKALAAYNWGPQNVDSGKPWPAETQQYVDAIAPRKGTDLGGGWVLNDSDADSQPMTAPQTGDTDLGDGWTLHNDVPTFPTKEVHAAAGQSAPQPLDVLGGNLQAKQRWLAQEGAAIDQQRQSLDAEGQHLATFGLPPTGAGAEFWSGPPKERYDAFNLAQIQFNDRLAAYKKVAADLGVRTKEFNEVQSDVTDAVDAYNKQQNEQLIDAQVTGRAPVPGLGGAPRPPVATISSLSSHSQTGQEATQTPAAPAAAPHGPPSFGDYANAVGSAVFEGITGVTPQEAKVFGKTLFGQIIDKTGPQIPISREDFATPLQVLLPQYMLGPVGDLPVAVAKRFANSITGQATLGNAALILGSMFGGEALGALANSQRAVALLTELPYGNAVLAAADLAARNAIPAAWMGVQTAHAGAGFGDWYRLRLQGRDDEAALSMVDGISSLLMAALSLKGVTAETTTAIGEHAPLGAGPDLGAAAYSNFGRPDVSNIRSAEAGARAASLRAQGRNLAAASWERLDTTQPQKISFNGQDAYISPVLPVNGPGRIRAVQVVYDSQGKVLYMGTPAGARDWITVNTHPAMEKVEGELSMDLGLWTQAPNRTAENAEGERVEIGEPTKVTLGGPHVTISRAATDTGPYFDADPLFNQKIELLLRKRSEAETPADREWYEREIASMVAQWNPGSPLDDDSRRDHPAPGPDEAQRLSDIQTAQAAVAGIKKGAQFSLRIGDARVKRVTRDGQVIFDNVTQGGTSEMRLPLAHFRSLILPAQGQTNGNRGNQQPEPAAPVATATPVTPVVPGTPVPQGNQPGVVPGSAGPQPSEPAGGQPQSAGREDQSTGTVVASLQRAPLPAGFVPRDPTRTAKDIYNEQLERFRAVNPGLSEEDLRTALDSRRVGDNLPRGVDDLHLIAWEMGTTPQEAAETEWWRVMGSGTKMQISILPVQQTSPSLPFNAQPVPLEQVVTEAQRQEQYQLARDGQSQEDAQQHARDNTLTIQKKGAESGGYVLADLPTAWLSPDRTHVDDERQGRLASIGGTNDPIFVTDSPHIESGQLVMRPINGNNRVQYAIDHDQPTVRAYVTQQAYQQMLAAHQQGNAGLPTESRKTGSKETVEGSVSPLPPDTKEPESEAPLEPGVKNQPPMSAQGAPSSGAETAPVAPDAPAGGRPAAAADRAQMAEFAAQWNHYRDTSEGMPEEVRRPLLDEQMALYHQLDDAGKAEWQKIVGDAWREYGRVRLARSPIGRKVDENTPVWELSPAQYLELHRHEALAVNQKGAYLKKPLSKWNTKDLTELTNEQLQNLLRVNGLTVTGNKEKLVQRVLENAKFRARMEGKTPRQLAAENDTKTLKHWIRFVNGPMVGNKLTMARNILGAITNQIHAGEAVLADANFRIAVQRAYSEGKPVPDEVFERWKIAKPGVAPEPEAVTEKPAVPETEEKAPSPAEEAAPEAGNKADDQTAPPPAAPNEVRGNEQVQASTPLEPATPNTPKPIATEPVAITPEPEPNPEDDPELAAVINTAAETLGQKLGKQPAPKPAPSKAQQFSEREKELTKAAEEARARLKAHRGAFQYLPEKQAEALRQSGLRPGPGTRRLDQTPFDANSSINDLLEHTDSFYYPARAGRPAVLYVNGQGRKLLEVANQVLTLGQNQDVGGLTLSPSEAMDLAGALGELRDTLAQDPDVSAAALAKIEVTGAALKSGVATDAPLIVIPLDGRPLHNIVTSRRHEGLHRALSQLAGGTRTTAILRDSASFLDSSDAVRHAADLLHPDYPEEELADEIFVRIGSGEWDSLDILFEDAIDAFAAYLDRLRTQYQSDAQIDSAILRLVQARVRKAYNERRDGQARGLHPGNIPQPPGGTGAEVAGGESPGPGGGPPAGARQSIPGGWENRFERAVRQIVSHESSATSSRRQAQHLTGPARQVITSLDQRLAALGINKQILSDLATSGAEHMVVRNANSWGAWSDLMNEDLGEAPDPERRENILRFIYPLAAATARRFGVEARPLPPPAPKPEPAPPAASNHLIPEADRLIASFRKLIHDIVEQRGGVISGHALKDNPSLIAHVKAFTGRSPADGSIDTKQIYDLLETAVNEEIAQHGAYMMEDPDVARRLADLRILLSQLPTQSIRSEGQVRFQQFSTPPTEALLAARVLAPTRSDLVLEPSAGTGGLAAFARASGARVLVNEVDPRRAELLRRSGYSQVSQNDAEQIDNIYDDIWPDQQDPTLVLMNPPFSAAGERGVSNSNDIGYRHVLQALQRLQPGGRLVAILGGGREGWTEGSTLTAPSAQPFWAKVRSLGTIRANIGINGKEYAKYGTTFGTRLVVIDKVPDTGVSAAPVTGDFDTLEDAWNALARIAADRQPQRDTSLGGDQNTGVSGLGESPRPGSGGGVREPGGQPGTPVRGGPGGDQLPAGQGGSENGSERAPQGESGLQPERPAGTDRGDGSVNPVELEARQNDPAPVVAQEQIAEAGEDIGDYSAYKPKVPAEWGARPHAAVIVETQTMASVAEPPVTRKPNIPQGVIDAGDVSDVQLAAISHAIEAHEKFLEGGQTEAGHKIDPRRLGFFLGDGTGVGKGRTIAGTVVHYWRSNPAGKRKTIWISFNEELAEAARDDLDSVGGKDIPIYSLEKVGPGKKLPFKEGVLFVPYSKLATQQATKADGTPFGKGASKADKAGGQKVMRRLAQILEWAGEEPLIIFDESHKMKNATAVKEEIGEKRTATKKPTATGLAGIELQNKVPRARVLYSSATGFSDVANMAYANRLGIWGPGTAFKDFQDFRSQIDQGGIGAMELVARDLKAQGKYLSRFISYDGVVFDESIHEITPEQHAMLDRAGEAWRMVIDRMNQAAETTTENTEGATGAGAKSDVKSKAMSQLWGAQLRFYRSLYTAMKVPTLIGLIDEALANHKAVVISVLETGKAQQDREIERLTKSGDDNLEGADLSPVASLIDMVDKNFPTIEYETVQDEHGNDVTRVKMVTGADGVERPAQNAEALRAKKQLLDELEKLKGEFPDSALDQILNKYGADQVAEMTKRSERLVRNPLTGRRELKSRGSDLTQTNLQEMAAFQNGEKYIALISNAASTGISLHSSVRAKNQRQRVHVMLQLKWSADMTMQDLGRTHRTAQAVPPHYILLSLNVEGEKRFAATIARRLEQLGALSRGERKAGGGATDFSKYNFESKYGRFAVDQVVDTLCYGNDKFGFLTDARLKQHYRSLMDGRRVLKLMGLYDDAEDQGKEGSPDVPVNRFFNRLMILPVKLQNELFRAFADAMENGIENARRMGTLDTGAELIRATHLTQDGPALVVYQDPATGAQAVFYRLRAQNPRYRLAWDDNLVHRIEKGEARLYRVKASGRLLLVDTGGHAETDPATGKQRIRLRATGASGTSSHIYHDELLEGEKSKYEAVRRSAAAEAEWRRQYDAAGPFVTSQESLITGSVLPIWNKIQERRGTGKSAYSVPIKVKIGKLDNGGRLIGAHIEPQRVGAVLKALGHEQVLTPEAVAKGLDQGKKFSLAQGGTLKRAKVSGEYRWELEGAAHFQRLFPQWGVTSETIANKQRWFVPKGNATVLGRVLKELPPKGESGDEETEEGQPQFERAAPDTSTIKPMGDLVGEAAFIQQKTIERVKANPQAFVDEYRERFGDHFNPDLGAELFPEYASSPENRAKFRMAVAAAGGWVTGEAFRQRLAEPDRKPVLFTAGGNLHQVEKGAEMRGHALGGRRRLAAPPPEPAALQFAPGHPKGASVIYGNTVASHLINFVSEEAGLGGEFAAANFDPAAVRLLEIAARRLMTGTSSLGRRDLMLLADRLGRAAKLGKNLIYVERGDYEGSDLRHEGAHTAQFAVGGGTYVGHIDAENYIDDHVAQKARHHLLDRGYEDDPEVIAAEIGAHLAEGPTGWAAMRITPTEAEHLRTRYVDALLAGHHPSDVYQQRGFSPILGPFDAESLVNADKHGKAGVRDSGADAQTPGQQSRERAGKPGSPGRIAPEHQGRGIASRSAEIYGGGSGEPAHRSQEAHGLANRPARGIQGAVATGPELRSGSGPETLGPEEEKQSNLGPALQPRLLNRGDYTGLEERIQQYESRRTRPAATATAERGGNAATESRGEGGPGVPVDAGGGPPVRGETGPVPEGQSPSRSAEPSEEEQPGSVTPEGERKPQFEHGSSSSTAQTNLYYHRPEESTPGILFSDRDTMRALGRVWNAPNINGVTMDERSAVRALAELQKTHPEMARALRQALRENSKVIVSREDRPLEQVVENAMHEWWHALIAEPGHLGKWEPKLRRLPLAQIAETHLKAIGVRDDEIADEIGARLAAGQYASLGLDYEQGMRLASDYMRIAGEALGYLNIERGLKQIRTAAITLKETLRERAKQRATALPSEPPAFRQGLAGESPQTLRGPPAGRGGIREGLPRTQPAFERAAQGKAGDTVDERGNPRITRLGQWVHNLYGSYAPKLNYTGIGGTAAMLPGGNLHQTEKASPATHAQALRAAGARGETNAIMHAAMPAIAKALSGSGVSFDEMRLAYTESRLRGIRERWYDLARQVQELDDHNLEQAFHLEFANLLRNIEDKRGMFPDVVQTAAALHAAGDWDGLRDFLETTFEDAAHHVAVMMDPPWFDRVTDAIGNNPAVHEAHRIYKQQVEASLAESHAENEGIFSTALGPLDTYYPLIAIRRPQKGTVSSATPFRAPQNPNQHFATGLSEGYDISLPSFRQAVSRTLRANSRAALLHTAEKEKLLQPYVPGQETVIFQGKEYQGKRVQVGQPRTLIRNGKVTHLPARNMILPLFAYKELAGILENEPEDPDAIRNAVRFLNTVTLKGPAEFSFHSSGLLGAVVANTPWLGKGLGDKALSLPLLKRIGALVRVLAGEHDPTRPENAALLIEMAKLGALPSKFGTETYSQEYARETGSKLRRFSFTPALYGPRGIDARARVLMYKIAKADKPDAAPEYYYHFVNQLGNYTPELQSGVERFLKKTGWGPFATAGMTRIVNGIMAAGGISWDDAGRPDFDWRLLAGTIAFAALYIMLYEELTGKLPWHDQRFKFFQIPVGGGHGWIDKYRHSKTGNALWGSGPEVGYLNFGLAFNPVLMRGLRGLGVPGAAETAIAHGDAEQVLDATFKDLLNTYSHPAMGPAARMAPAFLGAEPYLSDLRDRNGRFGPQFQPSIPSKLKPGLLGGLAPSLAAGHPQAHPGFAANFGARMAAAAQQLNSFGASLGEATGLLGDSNNPKSNPWARQMGNMLLAAPLGEPIGNPSNPYARQNFLRQQRGGQRGLLP
jgi:hypothetical protein